MEPPQKRPKASFDVVTYWNGRCYQRFHKYSSCITYTFQNLICFNGICEIPNQQYVAVAIECDEFIKDLKQQIINDLFSVIHGMLRRPVRRTRDDIHIIMDYYTYQGDSSEKCYIFFFFRNPIRAVVEGLPSNYISSVTVTPTLYYLTKSCIMCMFIIKEIVFEPQEIRDFWVFPIYLRHALSTECRKLSTGDIYLSRVLHMLIPFITNIDLCVLSLGFLMDPNDICTECKDAIWWPGSKKAKRCMKTGYWYHPGCQREGTNMCDNCHHAKPNNERKYPEYELGYDYRDYSEFFEP